MAWGPTGSATDRCSDGASPPSHRPFRRSCRHPSTEGHPMARNQEPVLTSAGVTAAVMSVLNVLVVLDVWVLDADQLATINIAVGSVLGVLLAVWARGRVSPA